MSVTNIRRRIKRYRAENPYSHTLFFYFLSASFAVIKIILVGAVLAALWVIGNNWMSSKQRAQKEAAVLAEGSSQQLESAGEDFDATDTGLSKNSIVNNNLTDRVGMIRGDDKAQDVILSDHQSAPNIKQSVPEGPNSNKKIVVNAEPVISLSSVPTETGDGTSESVTENAVTSVVNTESRALKISAYRAVLFDSINSDDAKQTLIDKDSTVFFIDRKGEWIKVTIAATRETGYVHSSQVIAE